MLEVFDQFGIEDIRSKMAAALQGSTETTFYVLAVYFGSVGRHGNNCANEIISSADLVITFGFRFGPKAINENFDFSVLKFTKKQISVLKEKKSLADFSIPEDLEEIKRIF